KDLQTVMSHGPVPVALQTINPNPTATVDDPFPVEESTAPLGTITTEYLMAPVDEETSVDQAIQADLEPETIDTLPTHQDVERQPIPTARAIDPPPITPAPPTSDGQPVISPEMDLESLFPPKPEER